MTVSSPTGSQNTNKQILLIERAESIGWYFIESYYDFYNKNIANLYKLYNVGGCLCHSEFKEGSQGRKTLHKARGIESLKNYFEKQAQKSVQNKIVVTSADIQICLEDNILIVVFGEWSKNDSDYCTFTQTFVLSPGKKENTFDLANDNLRYINFGDYEVIEVGTEKPKESVKVEENKEVKENTASSASSGAARDPKNETDGKEEKDVTSPGVEVRGSIDDIKPQVEHISAKETFSSKGATSSSEGDEKKTQENGASGQEEAVQTESRRFEQLGSEKQETREKNDDLPEEPSDQVAPQEEPATDEGKQKDSVSQSQPISWAALAAQQPPSSMKTATVSSPLKATPTIATAAAKKPTSSPECPVPQPIPTNQGKYKKEDWFPIYIRGVKGVDEEKLKIHLVKKFGEIKFFRVFDNIALCDFVSGQAQKKALDAKAIELDGRTIQLEVRESKNNKKTHKGKSNEPANSNEKYGAKKLNSKKNKSSTKA